MTLEALEKPKPKMGMALEALEKPRAKERMLTGTAPCETVTQGEQGRTREKVGKTIGMSGPTFQRAKTVIETAEDETLPLVGG